MMDKKWDLYLVCGKIFSSLQSYINFDLIWDRGDIRDFVPHINADLYMVNVLKNTKKGKIILVLVILDKLF